MKKLAVVLLSSVLLLAGCGEEKEREVDLTKKEVSFEEVAKEYGIKVPEAKEEDLPIFTNAIKIGDDYYSYELLDEAINAYNFYHEDQIEVTGEELISSKEASEEEEEALAKLSEWYDMETNEKINTYNDLRKEIYYLSEDEIESYDYLEEKEKEKVMEELENVKDRLSQESLKMLENMRKGE